VGSVFHELLTKTAASFTYDQATDSLEAVRDNMGTAQTGDSFPLVSTEVAEIYAAVITNAAGVDIAADIIALKAVADTIQADTDLLDDVSGGLADIHTDIAAVKTDTGNLVTRIPAALFSGITSLAQWIGLLAGKQVGNATALTEIKATGAGAGTFNEATDSLEAIRDTAPLGTAMRGTDSAALASVCTEGRLAELDAANLPTDVANVKSDTTAILVDTGTTLDARLPAALVGGRMDANVGAISADATAADNLEAQYDGTGYINSNAPAYQAQISAIAGGLSIQETVDSSTVISGSAAGAISLMNTDDDSRYVVTADGGTGALEFILKVSPTDTGSNPVEIHLHGFYDEGTGATNSLNVQAYNFNTAAWETVQVLTNAAADQNFDIPLHAGNGAASTGTVETVAYVIGDVLMKFIQATNETGSTMNIDHLTVGFAGSPLTAAEVNAEVLDVLSVDTFAEPGQGAPLATTTLANKIGYPYKAWRNRSTQTASQYSLLNDDGVTVDQKSTFSDNGTTADRGEVATGP
jgi:hypothetical protein